MAFFPQVSQVCVTMHADSQSPVYSNRGPVRFRVLIFVPTEVTEDNRAFTEPRNELHGKVIEWPASRHLPPSAELARIRYTRTLGRRIGLVAKTMVPPAMPERSKRRVSQLETSRASKVLKYSQTEAGPSTTAAPESIADQPLSVDSTEAVAAEVGLRLDVPTAPSPGSSAAESAPSESNRE